jgi:hypothetical protein
MTIPQFRQRSEYAPFNEEGWQAVLEDIQNLFRSQTSGADYEDLVDAGETALHTHDHGSFNGLADDDHPQYAEIAQTETITGAWTHTNTVTMGTDKKILFRDSGQYIHSSASNTLALKSTTRVVMTGGDDSSVDVLTAAVDINTTDRVDLNVVGVGSIFRVRTGGAGVGYCVVGADDPDAKLYFGDFGTYIQQGADTYIDVVADGGVRITSGGTASAIPLYVAGPHVSGVGLAKFFGTGAYGFLTLDSEDAGESGFLVSNDGTLIGQWGALKGNSSCYVKNRVYGTGNIMTWQSDGHTLITGALQLQFRDTAIHISSAADGHMDLEADTSVDINSILELEATTSSTGQITQAGTRILHTYGTNNLFLGEGAGNFTTTGAGGNVALGKGVLDGLTTGWNDLGMGALALADLTEGANCVAIGPGALGDVTTADNLTAVGSAAFRVLNAGPGLALGYRAGRFETAANKLFIDVIDRANEADGRVKALIYGEFNAATASQLLRVNGYLEVRECLRLLERSSDPTEPAEGQAVIWMSDGTGKGDDGDVMIASKAGGVTNYGTLFDHSGGAGW